MPGRHRLAACITAACCILTRPDPGACAQANLLNASYDPTRELYQDIDRNFAAQWEANGGQHVAITTVHDSSGAQARAVIDGMKADVVTLALASDMDLLVHAGVVASGWQERFPDGAVPFTTLVVFLVRRGNPKHVRDWPDLAGTGVGVVTPDPKTSGGGRWNYLAAFGWAGRRSGATPDTVGDYMHRLYANVSILDAGTRGATTTFVQRGVGDVMLTAESEARLVMDEFGAKGFEIVYPSVSIIEEPPVAVVDRTVDRKGDRPLAEAYLHFLWSPAGQTIVAQHHFRPRNAAAAELHRAEFPAVASFDIRSLGGWAKVQPEQFGSGGNYDKIIRNLFSQQ